MRLRRHHRSSLSARRDLRWGLCFLALLQAGYAVAVEFWLPSCRDPEFSVKFERLKARLAERPGSPLVLMLGTSRTKMGIMAKALSDPAWEHPALVFNFGMIGTGPLFQSIALDRLLAAGIRPDLVFIEIVPHDLNRRHGNPPEESRLFAARLTFPELRRLRPDLERPFHVAKRWARSRLVPGYGTLSEMGFNAGRDPFEMMDGYGYEPHMLTVDDEEREKFTGIARRMYCDWSGAFELARGEAASVRSMLDRCRREGIEAKVLLMPESDQFSGWYPPGLRAGVDRFLHDLACEFRIQVVDARGWLDDEDFWDGHHPLPTGAKLATVRFDYEVLRPWLRRRDGDTDVARARTSEPVLAAAPRRAAPILSVPGTGQDKP